MKNFVNYIHEFNTVSIVLRLFLATLLGGLVGVDREQKRHSAGFRTFTLVCLGSALATIVNLHIFYSTGASDPSRIAASVVSGIGFLGVGTIVITHKNKVRGLTTAACLWAVGCLGIALGSGLIIPSIVAFFLIVLTISFFRRLSNYIYLHSRYITLYTEILEEDTLDNIIDYLKSKNIKLMGLDKRKDKLSKNHISVILDLDCGNHIDHSDFILELGKIDGILYIEET